MSVSTKPVQAVLGVVFLGAGLQKLAGTDTMVDDFARFRYPPWFRVATGAVEVVGAAAMLAGLSRPALAPLGGLLLGGTMVGALATHARLGDSGRTVARPAALLALVAAVAGGSRPERGPGRPAERAASTVGSGGWVSGPGRGLRRTADRRSPTNEEETTTWRCG